MINSSQKRTLYISLLAIFFIVFIVIIILFFVSSTLTITTNSSSNQISVIQKLTSLTNPVNLTQNDTSASVRVWAGTYIVTVQNSTKSSVQIVKLGIGEHRNITMDLSTLYTGSSVTPISSFGAGSIVASSTTLRFIDRNSTDHPLYSISSGNTVKDLDNKNSYQNISWADPSFGIGLAIDQNNQYQIIKIQDDTTYVVNLPFTANSFTGFGVAPDKTWYVSDGKTVYKANGDGSFVKLYTTSDNIGISSVSNSALLLTQKSTTSNREGSLVILHTDGTKYQIDGDAYESAWSPSGDKLITSGDTSELYDSKFNKIGVLPAGNVISPVWLNNDVLLYSLAGNLWSYNVTQGSASIISTLDKQTGSFSQISPSISGDYVYASVQKGGNWPTTQFGLYRIPLQNQPAPDLPLSKLDIIIPNTVNGCNLNYMYFTSLIVVAKQPTQATNCIPATKSYIQSYNINLLGSMVMQTQ